MIKPDDLTFSSREPIGERKRKAVVTGMVDTRLVAGMVGLLPSTSDRIVLHETKKRQLGYLTKGERRLLDLYYQYREMLERGQIMDVPQQVT